MRRVILCILLFALVAGLSGCSSYHAKAYEYRDRAGTMYEYHQLMDAYQADSGNPPPLPPVSGEPAQGEWLRVPVRTEPVYVYDDYYPSRRVVVVEDPFYDDWYYPRPYVGTSLYYSPRRHYRGSGLSIGFGFGHGGYYGGYYGGPFRHGRHFGHYRGHGW